MRLRARDVSILGKFEPPFELVVKSLHALNLVYRQHEIAFVLGVSTQAIGKWLRMETKPKRHHAVGILAASLFTPSMVKQLIRLRLTLEGAEYVDRTNRARRKGAKYSHPRVRPQKQLEPQPIVVSNDPATYEI